MLKTITILFSSLLLISFLYAGENFSEMSTQELISIMGYVKKENLEKFKKELEARVPKMNEAEKKAYEKNLQKENSSQ
ncbi:MAG: DUF1104 domain-containing protein [Sulfurimonas sp.]|uniref:DUF1104 domain-containing protein n=1 Tax=Sulfurimonas sp. TaxID=2022749 RepID=UPI00262D9020|nr:DUF1104 domain-containing protein [Sulfurimonas sp.]MCW8894637.1 DUF1104 domain-containing protein [Sulfurimonas sp.]MCW8954214.1 DUF1104 domain-containing protein [Sulfurimonas sp.]